MPCVAICTRLCSAACTRNYFQEYLIPHRLTTPPRRQTQWVASDNGNSVNHEAFKCPCAFFCAGLWTRWWKRKYCDKQDVAMCYWGFADRFGKIPLLRHKDNRTSYLTNLCLSDSSEFPEFNFCKQHRYGRCTDSERKEFSRMERGYVTLREEITSAQNCEPVAQLRECIDLNVMRTCGVSLDIKSGTLEDQVPEQNRGAQNLKRCVEAAVQTCGEKKHRAAISHLLKIVDAIVELSWLPLMQNAAYPTRSATVAISACLMGLALRSYM